MGVVEQANYLLSLESQSVQEMYNYAGVILKKFNALDNLIKRRGFVMARKLLDDYHLDIKDVVREAKFGGYAECHVTDSKISCVIDDELLERFPFDEQGKAKLQLLFNKYSNLTYEIRQKNVKEAVKLIKEIKELISVGKNDDG